MKDEKPVTFAEGWAAVDNGYRKLIRIMNKSEEKFTSEEYMDIYGRVYSLCRDGYDGELYERYKSLVEDYIKEKVLPYLEETDGVLLLEEIAKRWFDHRMLMIRWLSRFFGFLDRYYLPKKKLPSLRDTGLECFRSLVYDAMYPRVKDAFLTMIHEKHEGEKADNAELKRTAEMFASIRPGDKDYDEELRELLGSTVGPKEGVSGFQQATTRL